MVKQLNRFWVYLIPISIISVSVIIGLSGLTAKHPELAIGITYDLTLLSPLLYLLAIWKKDIPKITAIPFFILGIIVSKLLLDHDEQAHLDIVITYFLPLVEIGVLIGVSVFVRRMSAAFKESQTKQTDYYSMLQTACEKVIGKNRIAEIFATEIGMISYALFTWKRVLPTEQQFTQTKMSSTIGLYVAVIMILLIESVPLHLLLHSWSPVLAWVITILSAYSLIQILGQMKSLSRRFHELGEDYLIIRNGIFSEMHVPYEQIESVEVSEKDLDNFDFEIKKTGMLSKMENHNIILRFNQEIVIRKFYGVRSKAKAIGIWVDEKQDFEAKLKEKQNLI